MTLRSSVEMDLDYFRTTDFWSRVDVQGMFDCWPWKLSTGSHGYGQTWDGVHVTLAHRAAWALWNSEQVPDQMTIDHICRFRRCCNPSHLRVLPNVENARMNGNWAKTKCKSGHEFTPENTRTNDRGHRWCRACHTEYNATRRAKKAA